MPSRLSLAALLAALALPVAAQAPRTIAFQGVLADGGAPVTTATDLTFRLYPTAAGGTVLWAETQSVTPNSDGAFSVRLGSVRSFDDVPFSDPLWLSVAADGTAFFPLTPLDAVPYALGLYGVRVAPPQALEYGPAIAAGLASNQAGEGAVVAGGGFDLGGGGGSNRALGDLGVVSGGSGNAASGDWGTVSGGEGNTASGIHASIGGGRYNEARGDDAAIAGGSVNEAFGVYAAIGGGAGNVVTGSYATVPGGYLNAARGFRSFAAGQLAKALHDGTFVWSDVSGSFIDSLFSTAPNQFLIRAAGGVGIGTNAPLGEVHVANQPIGLASSALENDEVVVEATDAVIGLYSTGSGAWGSALALGEADASGAIATKWGIARQTGVNGGLHFTFGTSNNYASNDAQMQIQTDGDVLADGSFTGGGADLAEYFPLGPGAAVRPGDLVGVRGGQVSLATAGAEQVMIASSDPAFVGNPDAEAGGALVALVGQAEVRLAGPAAPGDLLVASGRGDGTARAVSPVRFDPETDGPVAGRVLSAEGGRAVALVGVDEAAAWRAVAARQAERLDAQADETAALRAAIEDLTRRLDALDSAARAGSPGPGAPAATPPRR